MNPQTGVCIIVGLLSSLAVRTVVQHVCIDLSKSRVLSPLHFNEVDLVPLACQDGLYC